MESGGKGREEEQDGISVHSPCKAPPSSASSLPKEHPQIELELKLLQALEIYPLVKLQGIHRHFVLFGLMEFLRRSFDRQFSSDEVLQLLDRFYNLEMLVKQITNASSPPPPPPPPFLSLAAGFILFEKEDNLKSVDRYGPENSLVL
ncbi:uncharacterized protein LOC101212766 isoform X1 [Cucumis sativus]|uniref:uncharacterized protein LOC101212766 isoform X1 n=1 Tax=Cucumis sativus TaxID=3659 RepID=UPI0012F488E2|nr:uncharacterized protein LOC101212766 isoform X1 [Cucumis sativus]